MRETAGDRDEGVVAVAKLAIGLDPKPLRRANLDKIVGESGSRDLLGAFDG